MINTTNPLGQPRASSALPKRALSGLFTVIVLAVVVGVAYGLEVQPWDGAVPGDALVAGQDSSGADLYVCVASSKGGEHPGALGSDGICQVAWGGQVLTFDSDFMVVVGSSGSWVEGGDGAVPEGAFAAGHDGGPIYVCRIDGRPGKLADDGFCYVAEDGQEGSATSGYEVLVQ